MSGDEEPSNCFQPGKIKTKRMYVANQLVVYTAAYIQKTRNQSNAYFIFSYSKKCCMGRKSPLKFSINPFAANSLFSCATVVLCNALMGIEESSPRYSISNNLPLLLSEV